MREDVFEGQVKRVYENGMICYDDETPSFGKDFEMAKREWSEKKRLEKQWAKERREEEKEDDDDEDFEFDDATFVDDYVDSDEENEGEEKDDDNANNNKRQKTDATEKKRGKPLPKSFSTVDKSDLDRFPKFKEAQKLT